MHRAGTLLIVLALVLAGCLGGSPVTPASTAPRDAGETASRVRPDAWKGNLSEPVYDGVASHVTRIQSEDGTELSLSVYLPENLPEDERVPTLLQITPYQPLSPLVEVLFGDPSAAATTGPPDLAEPWRMFVERGAAYVAADARGTGGSEGCLDFGGSLDRADAQAMVKWIREQPWNDGRVVTDGVSHPGMGSVVAHAAVENLTGALAHAPVVSYYADEWYQGAKFENQFNGPAYQTIEVVPPAYGGADAARSQAAPCTGTTAADYSVVEGRFAPTWKDRDLARHAEHPDTPLLLTHGFPDENVHPDHTQAYWEALPEDAPTWLIMGWWNHGWPDMENHPAEEFADVRHRWLDHLLLGSDNGLAQEPRVLVEDSQGTWHESSSWPLEPSREVTLHPTADGDLSRQAPGSSGQVSYQDAEGASRGSWGDAALRFQTAPLNQALLVNGAPTLHLMASSSTEETKWVAYLFDVAPDGSRSYVSHGYADSHTWDGEDTWKPMEPEKQYRWSIRLLPTAVVLEEGHRLQLLVASQDSEWTTGPDGQRCFTDYGGTNAYCPSGIVPASTMGRAVNTVHVGPDATNLTLHWVEPSHTSKVPWS